MSALAAIHAKRRQVYSLREDEAWRDFVEKHTGGRSTKSLSPAQSKALLAALDAMGATGGGAKPRRPLEGPYAKKMQALWIACWNLGIVEKRDDKALNAFARKQAGVGHANWIRHADDARAVVEAMKAMLARYGVDWSPINPRFQHAFCDEPGYRIAAAQIGHLPGLRKTLAEVCRETCHSDMASMTRDQWIIVMNHLGRMIREKARG